MKTTNPKEVIQKLEEVLEEAKKLNDLALLHKRDISNKMTEIFETYNIGYDSYIKSTVFTIVNLADLDEYQTDYEFWLPSSLSC